MTLSEKNYKVCKRCVFPNEFEFILQIKKLVNVQIENYSMKEEEEKEQD